jgi:hypothetical protein
MIRHTIYARKGPVWGILYDSSYKLGKFERLRVRVVWFIIQRAINQGIAARNYMINHTKFLAKQHIGPLHGHDSKAQYTIGMGLVALPGNTYNQEGHNN